MNRFKKTLSSAFAALFVISTIVIPARADQPAMQSAKQNLYDAKTFLSRATADKGGHRNNAIAKVNSAISAVNSGIAYDRNNINRRRNSTEDNEFTPSSFNFDQPNMISARNELTRALNNLNSATADKGGYRNQAIALVKDAISEVNKGIEYDRTH